MHGPLRTMGQKVTDGHRQEMVGVHQAYRRGDDAVPVRVGVVGESHLVLILEADQPGHGIGAGGIHADLAVVVHGHEREGRVHYRVGDDDMQVIDGIDRLPVVPGGAAEGVNAQLEPGTAYHVYIDDVLQVVDVGQDEVFLVCGRGPEGPGERHAFHAGIPAAEQLIGPVLNPPGHVGVSGAAIGGVVLEAAVLGRIVRRRDDDAVCEVFLASAVVDEDEPGNHGGRGHAIVPLNPGVHAVAG